MPVISTGDTKSKPYLLYVGHRGGYKNFEGFLRAYASSLWLSDNFNVVCFGGGIFSRDEVALIKSLRLSMNHVIQVNGGDNKLASVYRDAALFVYPSLYEGFGIPPLEAMSLGCPVACSNTSSIPEVAGDAAEYFDPYDLDSMRTAMELVLSSEVRLNELIKLGKFRCARFSWDRCAKETLSVYKGLK
jgi:glycosyltransferase involved in cell wall biosynthesis